MGSGPGEADYQIHFRADATDPGPARPCLKGDAQHGNLYADVLARDEWVLCFRYKGGVSVGFNC